MKQHERNRNLIKTPRALAAMTAGALLLTGCAGGTETPTETSERPTTTRSNPVEATDEASDEPSPSPSEDLTQVRVTVKGDAITPNGTRIELKVGEPLLLKVESDRAGELHAHSRPEQTLAYPEGTSTLRLKMANPGVVEVEDHDTGIVVVQLEVR